MSNYMGMTFEDAQAQQQKDYNFSCEGKTKQKEDCDVLKSTQNNESII